MIDESHLKAALERALKSIAKQRGQQTAAAIRPILLANLERGRVHYYLNGNGSAQVQEYVGRVTDTYERLSPYLFKVQQARSTDVWMPLFEQIQRWVYNFLKRQSGSLSGLLDLTTDYAMAASERLLTAYFPYDTEFDAWACVLVQNVCREHLRRERKAPVVLDDELIERLSGLSQAEGEHQRRLRIDLFEAIENLSSVSRRRLSSMYYFQGLSLPEIAHKMGRNMTATYKLHFDALTELRKIWGAKGHRDG